MENEFLRKCDELTKRASDIEVSTRIALEKVKDATEAFKVEYEKFCNMEIPVINGEKIVDLEIDVSKLGNFNYVKQIHSLLPAILSKIEETGIQLINEAIR